MSPPRRRCLARGCSQGRRDGHVFCASHWALLEAGTRANVWQAARSGIKEASREAIREAIRELADKELRPC